MARPAEFRAVGAAHAVPTLAPWPDASGVPAAARLSFAGYCDPGRMHRCARVREAHLLSHPILDWSLF